MRHASSGECVGRKGERGSIRPLFVIIEINGSREVASGTGRQFSIVRVGFRGRSQLFAKAGHSRVDGLAIHIQKFRVAHFCFEERKG